MIRSDKKENRIMKIAVILLAFIMAFSSLGMSAFAKEEEDKQEKKEIEMRDEIRAQNDTIFELGGMINQLEEKNDRIKPYAQIGKSVTRYAKRRKQA